MSNVSLRVYQFLGPVVVLVVELVVVAESERVV